MAQQANARAASATKYSNDSGFIIGGCLAWFRNHSAAELFSAVHNRTLIAPVPFSLHAQTMPLSSLHDPDTLARAQRVLEGAWAEVEARGLCSAEPELDRTRLAYFIAGSLLDPNDESELIQKAVARFSDEFRDRG